MVRLAGRREALPQQEVQVPPYAHTLSGLRSHSNYSARVSCVNQVGASQFSSWLLFVTPESGEADHGGSVRSEVLEVPNDLFGFSSAGPIGSNQVFICADLVVDGFHSEVFHQ